MTAAQIYVYVLITFAQKSEIRWSHLRCLGMQRRS